MPAAVTEEQNSLDREALLDAAERLFYAHGIQAVGMDRVREASGLPLKRIYRLFATKEDLVVAMLRHRDRRWRGDLAAHVESVQDPRERVLAVFDWLAAWFAEPGFRGCAWINAHGELGSSSEAVLAEVRAHKRAFHDQLAAWVRATGAPVAEPVFLLAEGAVVTAAVTGDPAPAAHARAAVETLLGPAEATAG
ncbi:TetR/AcrR family transcriptional regulator [Streptomyces flaveolus]|uniref:TetR/AcrR family transcriptional regulator n=1 Tax=Streptomyces TaxID=1883 RepID=UPI0004C8AA0D|nr:MULTISPECIES: TetR/AcrR family transcriptional regulator [unclassified Streptomyces]KOV92511.1 TetR family transcriptional regulator [Streptomyces sp. NRRL WC-3723]MBG7700586.1 TetR/AcrR family transcriptional regulator [Streptomyces sp. MC1]